MQLPITNKDWEKPFPGFKIVGNLYYVGTYDLAAYLIATNDGLILINSGAPGSYPLMKDSIEQLGFKLTDIKIITSTHGHWDHVGDLAEFQKVSKARVVMSERDAPVLESGGNLDYRRPEGRGIIYDPIKVDQRLKDGDKFRLGTTEITVINSAGPHAGLDQLLVPDPGRRPHLQCADRQHAGHQQRREAAGLAGLSHDRAGLRQHHRAAQGHERRTSGCRRTPPSSTCIRSTSRAMRTIRPASATSPPSRRS